jgi:hypothetical protein
MALTPLLSKKIFFVRSSKQSTQVSLCRCVVISNIHIDNLLFYLFSNFTPNIARIEIQALYINSIQRRTEETKIRSLLNLKLAATILANCYVTSCALFRSTTTQTGLVAEWVPFSWC